MKCYKVLLVGVYTFEIVMVQASSAKQAREVCRRDYPGFFIDTVKEA